MNPKKRRKQFKATLPPKVEHGLTAYLSKTGIKEGYVIVEGVKWYLDNHPIPSPKTP